MKFFGYFDDVIVWQLSLEWYWSYALMFGVIGVFYLVFWLWTKFRYGWSN